MVKFSSLKLKVHASFLRDNVYDDIVKKGKEEVNTYDRMVAMISPLRKLKNL